MNHLLPYNLKDTPLAIFASTAEGVLERQILANFLDAVHGGMPLDPGVRRRLAWRPRLVAEILDSGVLSVADANALVATGTQAINVVSYRPSLLEAYTDLILSDPETAEQLYFLPFLLRDADRAVGVDVDAILRATEGHPARQLRILAKHDRDRFTSFRNELPRLLDEKKYESPAYALEWLAHNHVLPDEPLDPLLSATLMRDEGMTCLAMRILRDRIAEPITWEQLEGAIHSPRWIYQGLVSGLFVATAIEKERLILSHPAWLVEWLVDTRASIDTIKAMYLSASSSAATHELIGDLHNWFKAVAVVRMLRRAIPPAN